MTATIVVTGATSGLGRHIATRLARRGDRILAVGRDPARAATLHTELQEQGNLGSVATAIDLATLAGQRAFAELVHRHTDHVDALINNAGVMSPHRDETIDGYELNFAIHHLAPFALTRLLLPLLKSGQMPDGPAGVNVARVVNVNSAGHQTSLGGHHDPILDFDDLQSRHGYDPFLAYSRSKLANLLFTYELARRHGHELVVNALHPGVVRTDLGRSWPRLRVAAMQVFALSPAKAAVPVTTLAVDPVSTQGGYYDRTTPVRSSPPSYDRSAAERLWQLTEQICGTSL
jgi:NAD(P)-dependent dehydrogenase (short-subunit alcohol dehydrogenase family)